MNNSLINLQSSFTGDQWCQFQSVTHLDNSVTISLLIPSDLSWFVGHFPEQPVLPGVVQTHWACELAQHFFLIKDLRKVKNLKFKTMVLPNTSLDLELKFNDQKNTVSFEYKNQEESFSTAILQFNQD